MATAWGWIASTQKLTRSILFPEINLSLGNELYIHLCGGVYVCILTHTHILCITDKMRGVKPPPGSPEPLGREVNVLAGVKGHPEKSGLMRKPNDGQCPGSGEKVMEAESCSVQEDKQHSKSHGHRVCTLHREPAKRSVTGSFQPHGNPRRVDIIIITIIISILQTSKVRLRKAQGRAQGPKASRWQS